MYTVKTYLDRSSIAGIGVFAGEDIPEGAVVWEMVYGFDQTFTPEQMAALPEAARKYLLRHGYTENGVMNLNADYGSFTNHSEDANTVVVRGEDKMRACRAIKKGEEITCNYSEFNEHWQESLNS